MNCSIVCGSTFRETMAPFRSLPAINARTPHLMNDNALISSTDPRTDELAALATLGIKLMHVDDTLLVVSKPSGLLSVPGRGPGKEDCLVARVQTRFPEALIVHRLDRDTSGLLVLARNKDTHRRLSMLFQERQVEKRYVAVINGVLVPDEGEVDLPLLVDWPNRPLHKVDFISGKPSLTRYRVLDRADDQTQSRVELIPQTGRTHQLRVHMLALGHPILGDTLYADTKTCARANRLLLHAEHLAFVHPGSGEALSFSDPAEF